MLEIIVTLDNVLKVLRLFKFEEDKKYALLRIPLPSSIIFNIKRLSTTDAKKFCDKKSIFYSPNMRVLVFKDKEHEAYSVFKDLSIT